MNLNKIQHIHIDMNWDEAKNGFIRKQTHRSFMDIRN